MRIIFAYILNLIGLIIISPLIIFFSVLIFLSDFNNPFYISQRVGINGKIFNLIKFRSMKLNNLSNKIASTSDKDDRITPLGSFIRKYKIDELPQLINVLFFKMTLVGPRPNVIQETRMYTNEELRLLSVKPGITDIASIVFSDEGNILSKYNNANLAYNQLIRPWKSKLGIFYINHKSIRLDIFIIFLTVISIFNKNKALIFLNKKLIEYNLDSELIQISLRNKVIRPSAPPGSMNIITAEEIDKNYL